MLLWAVNTKKSKVEYKGIIVDDNNINQLTVEIFNIFYRTYREMNQKVLQIERNMVNEPPYKELLNLINPNLKFDTDLEYFVTLTNIFSLTPQNME
jgi:hypothetical protein